MADQKKLAAATQEYGIASQRLAETRDKYERECRRRLFSIRRARALREQAKVEVQAWYRARLKYLNAGGN